MRGITSTWQISEVRVTRRSSRTYWLRIDDGCLIARKPQRAVGTLG
jgi:hypothetical protein